MLLYKTRVAPARGSCGCWFSIPRGGEGPWAWSWWNYPITFPGFLLFTHAWNGYVYSADLNTEIEITGSRASPTIRNVVTRYEMRHCNFKRGALASSGWYTPGWGGLNALIGFFMVRYDDASTPAFEKAVGSAYGGYIANSIVEMVNGDVDRGEPEGAIPTGLR